MLFSVKIWLLVFTRSPEYFSTHSKSQKVVFLRSGPGPGKDAEAENMEQQTCTSRMVTGFVLTAFGVAVLHIIVFFWVSNGAIETFAENYINTQIELMLALNGQFPALQSFWLNITEFGDAFILFPVFAFLMCCRPQAWAALFAAVPLTSILARSGKEIANIPRPAMVLDNSQLHIIGNELSSRTSLPSGHTLTIFAVVTVVMFALIPARSNKALLVLWISSGAAFAMLVGYSRVAVGAHWPLDVVSGALLGVIGGTSGIYLAYRYTRWWHWMTRSFGQVLMGVLMLAWVCALLVQTVNKSTVQLESHWFAIVVGACAGLWSIGYGAVQLHRARFVSSSSHPPSKSK